jgi:hypothetical protein
MKKNIGKNFFDKQFLKIYPYPLGFYPFFIGKFIVSNCAPIFGTSRRVLHRGGIPTRHIGRGGGRVT